MFKKLVLLFTLISLQFNNNFALSNFNMIIDKHKEKVLIGSSFAIILGLMYLCNSKVKNVVEPNLPDMDSKEIKEVMELDPVNSDAIRAKTIFCNELARELNRIPNVIKHLDRNNISIEDLGNDINRFIYPQYGITLLMIIANLEFDYPIDLSNLVTLLLNYGANPFLYIPENDATEFEMPEIVFFNSLDLARRRKNKPVIKIIEDHMLQHSKLWQCIKFAWNNNPFAKFKID